MPYDRRYVRCLPPVSVLKSDRHPARSIIAIKDVAVHLRVPPDNLRLEVAKSAVISVVSDDEPKKSEK